MAPCPNGSQQSVLARKRDSVHDIQRRHAACYQSRMPIEHRVPHSTSSIVFITLIRNEYSTSHPGGEIFDVRGAQGDLITLERARSPISHSGFVSKHHASWP
jgi:hypothetical protein